MNIFTNGIGVFEDLDIRTMVIEEFPGMDIEQEKSELSPEQYLRKGRKILSLLRQKKVRPFSKDRVLEMVKNDWKLTQNAVANKIGRELEKKFIDCMEGQKDTWKNDAIQELLTVLPPCVKITTVTDDYAIRLTRACTKEGEVLEYLSVSFPGGTHFVPVGATVRAKWERFPVHLRSGGESLHVRNFRTTIAKLYLQNYILKYFQKMRSETGDEHYLASRLIGKVAKTLLPDSCIVTDVEELERAYEYALSNCGRREQAVYQLLYRNQDEDAAKVLCEYLDGYHMQHILALMQEDYRHRKQEAKMLRNLSGEYARSFETKRNIPDKVIKAMANSGFNEYFGYVEFDEDCDMALMEELYREYKALASTIGIQSYLDVSLRFRKLGNHKASGLYYPVLKCLCVDVRSPDSLMHEVGHMLDYHFGHISTMYAFSDIYDCYAKLLNKYMETEDPEVEVLKGKTKYNLSYYLQETEVFARCFEIYLVRCQGINNSICGRCEGFAYPRNEELEKQIRLFFDSFLEEKVKKGEKEDEEKWRKVS